MGGLLTVFKFEKKVEAMEVLEADDVRRRNSLAAYIAQFVTFEGEDYKPILDKIREDKFPKKEGKPVRVSSKLRTLTFLGGVLAENTNALMK